MQLVAAVESLHKKRASPSKVLIRNLRQALGVSFDLFKIMVPVVIVVKILQELDVIEILALPLGPVMKVVGLPGEMGLVWATAMVNNHYSEIISSSPSSNRRRSPRPKRRFCAP